MISPSRPNKKLAKIALSNTRFTAGPQSNGKASTQTAAAEVILGEDGIVRFIVRFGTELKLEHVKEIEAARRRVAGATRRPLLVDMRGVRSATREAREHVASDAAAALNTAQALLVRSRVSTMIGNFMLGLNKTPYPTRLFTSETAALKWLKKQTGVLREREGPRFQRAPR